MRCAIHGDSVNCPPFCTSQLAGTEDPGTPGGPPAGNTRELEESSENRTVRESDESKTRDVAAANRDVARATDVLAAAQRHLDEASEAITYASGQAQQAIDLLKKYDDAK